jgi:hypothetical protein
MCKSGPADAQAFGAVWKQLLQWQEVTRLESARQAAQKDRKGSSLGDCKRSQFVVQLVGK